MKTHLPIPQAENLCQSPPAEVLVLLQSCREQLQGDALAQALFWLGEAHYKLSNYAAAFGCFHEALQIPIQDPTIAAELHWHLAILHNEMGAFEEALHQLHFVLSMGNPDQGGSLESSRTSQSMNGCGKQLTQRENPIGQSHGHRWRSLQVLLTPHPLWQFHLQTPAGFHPVVI